MRLEINLSLAAAFFLVAVSSAHSLRAQVLTEYSLPASGSPAGIVTGPDGALWFTEYLAGRIGRITTAGAITEFPTSGGQPASITTGPDGNLWLAEWSLGKIGRMTTSGTLTEFTVPSGGSPQTIALGPDGALWFTEIDRNKIGRITTAGSVTEFSLTASASSFGIVAGPDGNLWFTDSSGSKIGRITPSGVVTEFPMPTSGAGPSAIIVGPDGNLWFAEQSGNHIGRITIAGMITEFPLPADLQGRVFDLAAGPDGNLWFGAYDAQKLGRMTTSGIATEFFLPFCNSGPYGVTTGPDGNLWFTEFHGDKIGRLGIGPPALTVSSVSPTSGSSSGGVSMTIGGTGFASDATVMIGLTAASGVSIGGATQASAITPRLAPGTLNDVVVTNPSDGSFGILFRGWLSDFSDVSQAHPLHAFVEKMSRNGITAGCGGGNYCPGNAVTRAQMAVFLLRSQDGPIFAPPACVTPTFADVPCSSPFAPWVNELAARSVTAGCGGGNYCPGSSVTRAQMSVFLLRTFEGSTYVPPACVSPTFSDVPCSSGFARWIEELARRGITAGCGGGNYCPGASVTRGQMAVFLTTTFGLTLSGP